MTFFIVGGPKDGMKLKYQGTILDDLTIDEVYNVMRYVEIEEHKYRIENFDLNTKTGELIY